MNPKKSYSEKLKHPKWQKKRLQILERDNWKCTLCGDEDISLNVHHKMYVGDNPWDTPNEHLSAVCVHCHEVLHEMESSEWMSKLKVISIIKRPASVGDFLAICVYSTDTILIFNKREGLPPSFIISMAYSTLDFIVENNPNKNV